MPSDLSIRFLPENRLSSQLQIGEQLAAWAPAIASDVPAKISPEDLVRLVTLGPGMQSDEDLRWKSVFSNFRN